MHIKLDEEVEQLLCCSMCKSDLAKSSDYFRCESCGLVFPKTVVNTNENQQEAVLDFRIVHPTYCLPEGFASWADAQSVYERFHEKGALCDSFEEYLNEIDSVREIYTVEYHIKGKVLDVGGHQGRLRHYLGSDVSLYVSVDPYINIFADIGLQPNLLHAYPCLQEPCNFIAANAEHLPFKAGSFDWVHMRSVVDHFADPYLAFLEAYRCTKVGGKLLVGLAILERKYELDNIESTRSDQKASVKETLSLRVAEKLKRDGFLGLLSAISQRGFHWRTNVSPPRHKDDHMFRLTYSELKDLYERTGWHIFKEHWQKHPFQYCVYTCGEKRESSSSTLV